MQAANVKNILVKARFAACENGARLLQMNSRAAGRWPVSKSVSLSLLSGGQNYRGELSSGLQKIFNALRNFSRKSSARQIKNQNIPRNQNASAPKKYE
jgi:hypothetical protein